MKRISLEIVVVGTERESRQRLERAVNATVAQVFEPDAEQTELLQRALALGEEATPRRRRRVPGQRHGRRSQRQVQLVHVAARQRLQLRRHRVQQRLVLLHQILDEH